MKSYGNYDGWKLATPPEYEEEEIEDAGETTVGTSVPPHSVTPRIVGAANVDAFKRAMGVCPSDGCNKISGHDGECREEVDDELPF